ELVLREKTEELDQYFTTSLDLFCIADTNGYFRRLIPLPYGRMHNEKQSPSLRCQTQSCFG
ncbi:MAG: hypothetical protein ACRCUT_04125, partial [Spirochaetota bacterium]